MFGFGKKKGGTGRDDRPFYAYQGADLAQRVLERFEHGASRLKDTRRDRRITRAWRSYYARSDQGTWDTTEIADGGSAGELTLIKPNEFRNLLQHTLTLATASPPAYDPVAVSTDSESQAQTALARGLLDYYHKSKGFDDWRKRRAEIALLMGESMLIAPWDSNSGEVYLTQSVAGADGKTVDRPVYEGDFKLAALTPYEYVYPRCDDPGDPPWLIAQVNRNRYDLLALYPAHREQIMAALPFAEASSTKEFKDFDASYDDDVAVWHMWVKPCPSCPNGLDALILNAETVLLSGPLTYGRVPAFRCAPADIILGAGGYSQFFDVLPVNDAYAAQVSTILSRHTNGGVQPMWAPPGAGVNVQTVAPGMKLIQSKVKPEVVDLFKSLPELFTFADFLRSQMERLTVINPALRGDVSAVKGDSGAKTALMHATSSQFAQGFQGSLRSGDEALGTHVIRTIRTHATTKRTAMIAGRHNTRQAKKYDGTSIDRLTGVVVHSANPFRDSFVGRQSYIDWCMKLNLIKTPAQLWTAINSGRLEPLSEVEESEALLIRRENEILSDVESTEIPIVSPLDRHAQHLAEHQQNTASPEARKNPALVQRNIAHMQQHINALQTLNPALLMAIGEKPMPPAPPPGMAPPGPPLQQGSAPGMPGEPPQGGPPKPPRQDGPGGVKMPLPPTNPATGNRADIQVPAPPPTA